MITRSENILTLIEKKNDTFFFMYKGLYTVLIKIYFEFTPKMFFAIRDRFEVKYSFLTFCYN